MKRVDQRATDITLPLLIAQGGKDTMPDPPSAEYFHIAVSSRDKHLHIYPEAYHESLNGPEAGHFLQLVADSLAVRVNSKKPTPPEAEQKKAASAA